MKLSEVVVTNFRSIKSLEIDLSKSLRILVGKNEAGKSNILRAMQMLSPEACPDLQDVREPLSEEGAVDKASIEFVFEFSQSDHSKVLVLSKDKILCRDNVAIATMTSGQEVNLLEFCREKTGLYYVDVKDKSKNANYYSAEGKLTIGMKKPTDTCPDPCDVFINSKSVNLKKYRLIDDAILTDHNIPENYLEEASFEDLDNTVGLEVCSFVENNIPPCVFWEYKDEYILPGNISIEEFKANPKVCVPLEQMFLLYGCASKDISDEITNARAAGQSRLRNLLNRVADRATKYIHKIWKEYRDFQIFLAENGDQINAGVKDKSNVYPFEQRSDGFKRLVSFLLMIASANHRKELQNSLILIDEPDIGLHPSASRHLRDELIRISESNTVVYSTHSIPMICGEHIDSHLIVKRQGEITNVHEPGQSEVIDEEVLFNAIGYSLFEHMKETNFIFEGWRDKELFRVALTSKRMKFEAKYVLKNVGVTHARGVKQISNVANLLELANRKMYIVSDDDGAAREKQKEHTNQKLPGEWLRYSEISQTSAVTGEDFISIEKIGKALATAKKRFPELQCWTYQPEQNQVGILSEIKTSLSKFDLDADLTKLILSFIKEKIFDDLKSSNIKEEYFEMLAQLAEQINADESDNKDS